MAFPSFLVITFCIFLNIDWALSQDHEALVVIDNFPSPVEATLPYKAEELNGQIIYPNLTKDGTNIEYSYLCPLQSQHVKNKHPALAFWLEKTPLSSTEQPSKCLEEVKPIFSKTLTSERRAKKCGRLLNQVEHTFGFLYLKFTENQPEGETVKIKLYDICINQDDLEESWTKHLISTTSMLQEPGFPSQQIQLPYELSTEDYAFPTGTFLSIVEDYEHTNRVGKPSNFLLTKTLRYFLKEIKHHKMIPQMKVPQEDLALKLWKKSATHYVNTAPLWDQLVPLMKAINDGIRKAGIAVGAQHGDTIYIYTIAQSCGRRLQLGEMCFKSTNLRKHRFNLNVWCKFVHNESKNEGLMVFLHNIPDNPPKKKISSWFNRTPTLSIKNIECETLVSCDFRKWADDSAGLSDNLLHYAYCCEVDNQRVEEFFNIKFNTKLGLFNIDRIIDESSGQIVKV